MMPMLSAASFVILLLASGSETAVEDALGSPLPNSTKNAITIAQAADKCTHPIDSNFAPGLPTPAGYCTFQPPRFKGFRIWYGSPSPQEIAREFCRRLRFDSEYGDYPPRGPGFGKDNTAMDFYGGTQLSGEQWVFNQITCR